MYLEIIEKAWKIQPEYIYGFLIVILIAAIIALWSQNRSITKQMILVVEKNIKANEALSKTLSQSFEQRQEFRQSVIDINEKVSILLSKT